MKKLDNNRGITLVALVVIIVVLLILAGVSITAVVGNSGIINQATEAKYKTENASKNEKYDLAKMEDIINETQAKYSVNQVTDVKPGILEGNGTDIDPYVINSIEDLIFFAYDVTQGNTYEGKTVKLGLSLDFNSTKSYVDAFRTDYGIYGYNGELKTLLTTGKGFIPIGTTYDANISTNYFLGEFDGDYKIIYNLYQNFEDSNNTSIIGLFSTNVGTITNLILKNANMNSMTNNMHIVSGIVAGRNKGTIRNCGVSGSSKLINEGVKSIYCAGITGQAMGIVENCFSKTNITIESSNLSNINIGGIAGALNVDYIKHCYNMGDIIINTDVDIAISVGGICGGNNTKTIENCYNVGNISFTSNCTTSKEINIGNITGFTNNVNSEMKNCYNTGNINIDMINDSGITYIGNVTGGSYKGSIVNCYNIGKIDIKNTTLAKVGQIVGRTHTATLENCSGTIEENLGLIGSPYNTTTNNSELIKKEDIPSIIDIVGEGFKQDSNNINNGYPILDWQ